MNRRWPLSLKTSPARTTAENDSASNPYRGYFQDMPCYLTILDPDLRVTEANRRFREAFGGFEGKRCYELCKRQADRCINCPVERSFLDGQSHSVETQFITRRGETVPLIIYTMPISGSEGEVSAVLEMAIDITPVRQLQSKLESLGLLIGTISHSIKGLCTGLDGGIYLVNSGKEKGNPVRQDKGWSMVQRNANRLRRLVNNTLYYAKERAPKIETVSVYDIHKELLATLGAKAKRLGIEVRESVRDSLGTFEADHAAICSALVNLFENSLDACHADTSKPSHTVSLVTEGDEGAIRFHIEDNGIGMDEETRDRAVGLFFSSKGAGGTGLGLYVASKIAKTHGGRLEIDSTAGQGTRMTIILPRRWIAAPPEEPLPGEGGHHE